MRKKSKNPIRKAKDEADRALQDAYRRNYPNEKCESCGQRFYCMHHHLEKAKSNFCRYYKDNLIFICKKCHDAIHFGDNQIISRYTAKRGKKWVAKMDKLKQETRSPYTLKELIKEKEKWDKWTIKLKFVDSEEF